MHKNYISEPLIECSKSLQRWVFCVVRHKVTYDKLYLAVNKHPNTKAHHWLLSVLFLHTLCWLISCDRPTNKGGRPFKMNNPMDGIFKQVGTGSHCPAVQQI